jgi:hypothetical protein
MNIKAKRKKLFLFCLLGILVVYVGYFFYKVIPSFFGDSFGVAIAWIDNNGNGKQDYGEQPLEGVCVWAGRSPSYYNADQAGNICTMPYYLTNAKGERGQFFAGTYCRDIYIFAKPPEGYQPTTSLGGNACTVEFGFVPEGSLEKADVLSPAEFAQPIIREQTTNRLKQIGFLVALIVLAAIVSIILTPAPKESK